METGIAKMGIKAERQFCKNKSTTKATKPSAISSVPATSLMEVLMMVMDS